MLARVLALLAVTAAACGDDDLLGASDASADATYDAAPGTDAAPPCDPDAGWIVISGSRRAA